MPCTGSSQDCYPSYHHTEVVYKDRDNPDDKRKIAELIDQNKWLEAGLCAIITELEKKGIANEIVSLASKNGLINLMNFWLRHSKEDEARLSNELHKFSEHEQTILKKLLK